MLAEVPNIIDTAVRSGIYLIYVFISGLERMGHDASYTSLTGATAARKEISVSHMLVRDRLFEGFDNLILADNFRPFLWTICAV